MLRRKTTSKKKTKGKELLMIKLTHKATRMITHTTTQKSHRTLMIFERIIMSTVMTKINLKMQKVTLLVYHQTQYMKVKEGNLTLRLT